MFVAPLSLPAAADRPVARARATAASVSRAPLRVLAAWFVGGASALALVPALRGGATLGATLPFWLVAAPAINLAWFARGRIAVAIRRALRRSQKPVAVQARRLQSRPRPDRSSRK
jgi:hypothetical protein